MQIKCIEAKPSASSANCLAIEKLAIPKFKGNPKKYISFRIYNDCST
jgi:hypothetical protein